MSVNGHRESITIAVDAMGGDHGPIEVVQGARDRRRERDQCGACWPPEAVRPLLEPDDPIRLVEAGDVIGMGESPLPSVNGPDSSLARAIAMVAAGEADAAVSAGNSGAIMAGALLGWGRQTAVLRPAYGGEIPTRNGHTFILDIGANSEVKPEYLLQFAIMAAAYMRVAHGMNAPRIGLLNNGTEEGKGTMLTREAHALLQPTDLNFIGNVEATHVFEGAADIVVTDGFTGNVLLKAAEGVAQEIFNLIRGEVNRDFMSRGGAALMKPALRRIKRRLDYEEYGGAPLLGVNGVMVNAHGKSRAKAIANAITLADRMARDHLQQRVGEYLQAYHAEDGSGRGSRVMRRLHIPRSQRLAKREEPEAESTRGWRRLADTEEAGIFCSARWRESGEFSSWSF